MGIAHPELLPAAFAAVCGLGDSSLALGLSVALFGAGLFGGFTHCAPMCAPFVVMQLTGTEGEARFLRRLSSGALPSYHLGRMTTYVVLGAVLGGFGGAVAQLTEFRWFLASLMAAAALFFLLQAAKRVVSLPQITVLRGPSEPWARAVARSAKVLLRQSGSSRLGGYWLGLVLGFLPCGFLYAALIAATASGSAGTGALAMAGFALGTVPGLVAVGLLGNAALWRLRGLSRAIAAPIFFLNAMTLATLATRLMA